MSGELPNAIAAERRSRHRQLGIAISLLLATLGISVIARGGSTIIVPALSFIATCIAAYRVGYYERRLPEIMEKYEIELEERRLEMELREERRSREADDARRRHAEADVIRKEALAQNYLAVLASERGSKFRLSTSLGDMWVTHCLDQRVRVWWPDFSPVLRSGVAVMQGRAKWEEEEPKGWYIYRGQERAVLVDLSQL